MKTIPYSEASQIFTKSDRIYKILNNINLENHTLTVPSGCTLDFQGGVFSGGTLNINGAVIHESYEQLTAGQNLTITGNPAVGTKRWHDGFPSYWDGTQWADISKINQIAIEASVDVNVTASPGVIFVGSESSIAVGGTSKVDADSIVIKRGGTTVVSGSGKTASGNDSITPSASGTTTYDGTFVINGVQKTASRNVTAVHKIYYGSGATEAAATTTRSNATTSPVGTYNVTVASNGQYIFFVVPSNMTINGASLSGFAFPLDSPTTTTKTDGGVSGVAYKVYRSSNTYDAGTYSIVIS